MSIILTPHISNTISCIALVHRKLDVINVLWLIALQQQIVYVVEKLKCHAVSQCAVTQALKDK